MSRQVKTKFDGEKTMSTADDRRKQSIYFPGWMLDEMRSEASRLDRSLSWVVHRAWRIARKVIREVPDSTVQPKGEGQ